MLVAGQEASEEAVEEEDCTKLHDNFLLCTRKAFTTYKNAIKAGPDGREHWRARMSCNYLTASFEGCGSTLIGPCMSAEKVQAMKDEQLPQIISTATSSVEDWDSEKCPPIKAHLERMYPAVKDQTVDIKEKEVTTRLAPQAPVFVKEEKVTQSSRHKLSFTTLQKVAAGISVSLIM